MTFLSFLKELVFGVSPLPTWAKLEGTCVTVDAEAAFGEYFGRLGYPRNGFTAMELGVARKCMMKDLQGRVAGGVTVKFVNSGRFNPDKCVPGPFINWAKEYERISG